MQIGQLAQHAGVAVDTVRYYEKQGLLPAPPRRGSYRAYEHDDVLRLRFIRRAKALGFTLGDIASLLDVSAHRNEDMGAVRDTAAASKYTPTRPCSWNEAGNTCGASAATTLYP